jgi:carbonic anhydrase
MIHQGRRTFLRTAAVGGLGAFVGTTFGFEILSAAGGTDALLLSCMDYRLVDSVNSYMNGRGLKGKYDHVILAGAALGATTNKFPDWNKTFWEHLDTAIQLHNIHEVIVLDHRDCGAYKVILGQDLAPNPAQETAAHGKVLRSLRDQVKAKHPNLTVELGLMGLEGKVEAVS